MAPEATSMTMAAEWSILISTQRIKQKSIQLSQKQSDPTPTAASGQNSHLLHMLPTVTLLRWSVSHWTVSVRSSSEAGQFWRFKRRSFDSSRLSRKACAFWASEVGLTENFIHPRVNPSSWFVLSASGLHVSEEKLGDTAYSQSGFSTQPCF